ncbi:MAG: GntR family transcriptional regulator, partial [Gammaproteobacteria bacterium]
MVRSCRPEPELGGYFQVSRGTIRQALREPAAEGLIETRGRSGTYVRRLPMPEYNADAEDPHRRDDEPSLIDTWFSVVKRAGRTPSEDFRFRIEPATASVASRLHAEVNDLVVVRECIRHVDEIPWSEQVSYYP